MNFRPFIARRYLFAKKSHNVINVISLISATGVALGTMALIIILSVSNGFNDLIKGLYNSHDADLTISAVKEKVFVPDAAIFDRIRQDERVRSYSEVLEDNVFVYYDGAEAVGVIKGVDSVYEQTTGLIPYLIEGDFELYKGDIPHAVVGKGIARELSVSPRFVTPLMLYSLDRTREISMLDPTSSLRELKVFVSGVVALEQDFDKTYIFTPLECARDLLDYQEGVSYIEINLQSGTKPDRFIRELRSTLGENYTVKNRYQQNETVYKMMITEKAVIFIILFFVIIIISFNVFGSLSMLVMEKREDIQILKSLGADSRAIVKIFELEGQMIIGLGIVVGVVLGIALSLLQQHFGLVKIAGGFIVNSYPVIVKFTDILITVACVGTLGYLITRIPKRYNKYFI